MNTLLLLDGLSQNAASAQFILYIDTFDIVYTAGNQNTFCFQIFFSKPEATNLVSKRSHWNHKHLRLMLSNICLFVF